MKAASDNVLAAFEQQERKASYFSNSCSCSSSSNNNNNNNNNNNSDSSGNNSNTKHIHDESVNPMEDYPVHDDLLVSKFVQGKLVFQPWKGSLNHSHPPLQQLIWVHHLGALNEEIFLPASLNAKLTTIFKPLSDMMVSCQFPGHLRMKIQILPLGANAKTLLMKVDASHPL
eukprot:jgi/Psemu1/46870/gm1.46870_g